MEVNEAANQILLGAGVSLAENAVVLQNQRDYYRELARLRGELVGYLMNRNAPRAGYTIKAIEDLGPEPLEGNFVAGEAKTKIQLTLVNLKLAQDLLEEVVGK